MSPIHPSSRFRAGYDSLYEVTGRRGRRRRAELDPNRFVATGYSGAPDRGGGEPDPPFVAEPDLIG